MKFLICLSFLFSFQVLGNGPTYLGSSPMNVWNTVISNPYNTLPSDKISYRQLWDGAISLIERSANRTLNDQNDIIPYFNKLAHPNGLCLKGFWQINKENTYSGLFKMNSQAIIIARASVALNETERGNYRGFGLAGKIFPTMDDNQIVKTANFFVVDDLGGTKLPHYTDSKMTNEPSVSVTTAAIKLARYAATVAATFSKVDMNPGKRQVYEIAEANRQSYEPLKVPKWMMISANPNQKKVDEWDFRDELSIDNNNGRLEFDISVASNDKYGRKNWEKIGSIVFYESIASLACDHQLHFHHPKWRNDIE
jgi:hypothetical protein